MIYTRIILFGCSLLLCVGTIASGPIVQAREGGGGQVSINGKISFHEETTESSGSANIESSSELQTKPRGKWFPNTGEKIRKYSLIGGGLILLAFLILFLRKRRKGGQK
ncbi:LPXTG cell wall anchor domain-containing protein [Enterococcus plantarum]